MRSENSNKFEGQKLGLLIFEGIMAVLYLIFAVVFLFPSLFHLRLAVQDGLRIALGIILSLYGIFRIYRTIKKMR
jgi:ABC-type nickel/cobalt efflux system permease component RcnA